MAKRWATLEQVATTFKRLGYKPRHLTSFHLDRRRIKLLSGGEGSGKSLGGALDVPLGDFPYWKLGYIVGPKYGQERKEFAYILEALRILGAVDNSQVSQPKTGKWSLKTALGQEIITLSADEGADELSGTGESPDWIILAECGKLPIEIYRAARSRIARSRGKLTLCGTIEEANRWYPELINEWQADNESNAKSFIVPTWDNRVMYPEGENDPELLALKDVFTEDRYKERFGAVPVPPSALVLREFSNFTHVSKGVVHDELTGGVEIWMDPGYSGSHYSLHFTQIIPRWRTIQMLPEFNLKDVPVTDVLVLDELYLSHATTYEVIPLAQANPLWEYVTGGVGDVAIKQHAAMPSHFEVWQSVGGVFLRSQFVEVDKNIERHRTFLKDPSGAGARIFYHPKCKGAITEYGRWKRKELGDGLYGAPEAGNCDAMKDIGYGLVDHFGIVEVEASEKKRKPQTTTPRDRALYKAFGGGRGH